MKEKVNDKSIWDEIYRKTDHKPGWDRPGADPNLLSLIGKYGPSERPFSLLDVGCGNGRNASLADELNAVYTGTDFSESAVTYCREQHGNKQFHIQDICADLEGTELYSSGPYDVIMDCGCFHAIPPEMRESYKKNILKLLNEEGLYVMGGWYRREGVDRDSPQYFPYLYLSEWFYNEEDMRELFEGPFELVEFRVDKEIYPEFNDGFAYFALKKK